MRAIFNRRSSGTPAVLALLCLALAYVPAAQAANPRVTLKLQNVTAPEAVEALRKASGVEMRFDAEGSTSVLEAGTDRLGRSESRHIPGIYSSLKLEFHGQVVGGDADRICEIANVTAVDDLGNVLVSSQRWAAYSEGLPDEWRGSAMLTGYDPHAHKLVWLEGELEQLEIYQDRTLDIPLPLAETDKRREIGRLAVDIEELKPGAQNAAAPESVRLLVTTPPRDNKVERAGPYEGPVEIALVGASGKLFFPMSESAGPTEVRGRGEYTCSWGTVPEKVTTLRVLFRERGNPQPLGTFRLTDIPLPDPNVEFKGRIRIPPPEHVITKVPDHPFFDAGGGSISGLVRLPGNNAVPGSVSFGLKPVTPEGSARWTLVRIRADGTAWLENIRPGTYRVLRIYRPEGSLKLPASGHWRNGMVTIEIRAGKKTVLPPLEWTVKAAPLVKPPK